MSIKSYRGTLPKPDSQGRWRPVVGRSAEGKPQRFQVGKVTDTTTAEAQRRLDYIRDLWDRQCAEHGIDFWAGWVMPWANRLAAGPVRVYGSKHSKINSGQAAEEVAIVQRLQSWGMPIQIVDPELETSGYGFLRNQIETEVNKAVQKTLSQLGKAWGPNIIEQVKGEILPENLIDAETRTLHEAIDAFSDHLSHTGKKDKGGNLFCCVRKRKDRLRYLKQHHKDLPLWRFDLPTIEIMAAYWRNRPITKKGNRCAWDHAHSMLKSMFQFLEWMDSSPNYKWEMPKGVNKISRSPIDLPEDNNKEAFRSITKETFSPQQLRILAEHTDTFGKALLGVCVNCAFGASEVGQMSTRGYSLYNIHPHADRLGIKSTNKDSWIVGDRPKTGVYGEHLLWPAVADAVAPFLDGREVLPITAPGKPLYRPYSGNAQSSFSKWWSNLLDRVVKKHPDFPRLPFGSLRDLLPDILRREFSDQVADMCLQHGDPKEHDLLKCYANVPYKKLFEATRQLEEMFRPFLDVLKGQ